jgi:HNH endonuclease
MNEKRRCSTLFHLLVPGGKWHTDSARPVSSANLCNSHFQSRKRDPLLPPASAVMRIDGALPYRRRPSADSPGIEARRAYVTVMTQRRLHQQSFRQRVLRAYQERCAICRLRHQELLEAAHILPDGHPRGEPIIPNGLALCKLHHAAFDRHILGVRPDLVVELRMDTLREIDGPMLQHGLQGFQGATILVPHSPRLRPNRDFLEERYALFRKAS